MRRVFSSREVGKMVGADPSSVNRWIDSGRLKAYRTPGGHRRVFAEDLVSFLGGLGIPLPAELRPGGPSLLLVDGDEASVRALRKGLLRLERELEISTSTSALEALIQLGSRRPDALLFDLALGGVDALELCRRVKANAATRAVTLIACAARPTTQLETRLRDAGAIGLLPKPVKPAALLELARASGAASEE